VLTSEQHEFLQRYVTIDGDGNIVGNDNTVQVTKVDASTYTFQKDEWQFVVTVQDLRRVFNIEHSQVGFVGDNNVVYGGVHFHTEPLVNSRERRNRAMMLQRVYRIWIEGVLKRSLQGKVLLDLDKDYDLQDRESPQVCEIHLPERGRQSISSDMSILEIFERCNGTLLILGKTGGGKTTTLLQLTHALLLSSKYSNMGYIPAVFKLSSWTPRQMPFHHGALKVIRHRIARQLGRGLGVLEAWLIQELSTQYRIPRKIARSWLENDLLIPLLDGLNEVRDTEREHCVDAINAFHQTHLVPLAVCSNIEDYVDLTKKLDLQGTIYIRPLSSTKIDVYLDGTGIELQAVRAMLQHDPVLQELARSPLMLSTMTSAYQGLSAADLSSLATLASRRHHLFDMYIIHMFQRQTQIQTYSPKEVCHWTAWLAQQMIELEQGVFLVNNLQADFLISGTSPERIFFVNSFIRFLVSLVETLLVMLFSGLLSGFIVWLGRFHTIQVVFVTGLSAGLIWSSLLGIIWHTAYIWIHKEEIKEIALSQDSLIKLALGFGVLIGLVIGLDVEASAIIVILFVLSGFLAGALGGLVGSSILYHFTIRAALVYNDCLPWHLMPFLKNCVELRFLNRVSGGYMFVHRLLQEHFASLTPKDIERLYFESRRG
jgi:hypothetical protein